MLSNVLVLPFSYENYALKYSDLFLNKKLNELYGYFDNVMKEKLPVSKIEEVWNSFLANYGKLKRRNIYRSLKYQDYEIVYVKCEFEKGNVMLQFTLNQKGEISGLFLRPMGETFKYLPPEYVNTNSFSEEKVEFGDKDWKLKGVISIPKGEGPFPAVILIHGSGPLDMDETIGKNKPFRDLAWGLASQGIVVLRYNKRTYQYPSKILQLLSKLTVKEETIDDAIFAYKFLKNYKTVKLSKIFMLGHSLGGMLLPRIAKSIKDLGGIIILAGNARPLEDLIIEQSNYLAKLDGKIDKEEKKELEELERKIRLIKSSKLNKETPISSLPFNLPASYWIDLKNYNQVETAKSLNIPVLILQGERDYQVTMEDFNLWKQALKDKKNVTFKSYPALNHLFMEGKGKSSPKEYFSQGHIARYVIKDIADWIKLNSQLK